MFEAFDDFTKLFGYSYFEIFKFLNKFNYIFYIVGANYFAVPQKNVKMIRKIEKELPIIKYNE